MEIFKRNSKASYHEPALNFFISLSHIRKDKFSDYCRDLPDLCVFCNFMWDPKPLKYVNWIPVLPKVLDKQFFVVFGPSSGSQKTKPHVAIGIISALLALMEQIVLMTEAIAPPK